MNQTNIVGRTVDNKIPELKPAPVGIDGKPLYSLYLEKRKNPVDPPKNLEKISKDIFDKRSKYFSDPNIMEPLTYTQEEIKIMRYICETDKFYSLAHIGINKYMLSPDARLLTIKTGFITKGSENKQGRMVFTLREKEDGAQQQIYVNVLMAWAFLGPPPTETHKTVDHMDIDPNNNYFYNLRWATGEQQANNKRKRKNQRGRPVTQINPHNGFEIVTWLKIKYANKIMGLGSSSTICNACDKNIIVAGFKWRYSMNLLIDKNGKIEEWRPAEIQNFGSIYVSSMGQIYTKSCGFNYGCTLPDGRKGVYLKSLDDTSKSFNIHRLVMLAFKGPPLPDKPHVNHINGNPKDNRIDNLEYISARDNNIHAIENGLRSIQINGSRSKPVVQLTKNGQFIKEYQSLGEVCRQTGFRKSNVAGVLNKVRPSAFNYKWIYSSEYFSDNSQYK